jgi:Fe-S-cluster containining protein
VIVDEECNTATAGAKILEQNGAELKQLERQVERGHLFAHSALGESFLRLGELQAFLLGLIDTLLKKGVVTSEEIAGATTRVRQELTERKELSGPGTMVRVDQAGSDSKPPVKVDCQARLHVCHAACCKLQFALTVPELESGKIKWDLGRPYFIRHNSHGSCVHVDPASGACRIYADRPGVCRGYSCAGDTRIWKDFDKMELNTEWIEANLSGAEEPRLVSALMHDPAHLSAIGAGGQQLSHEDVEQGNP